MHKIIHPKFELDLTPYEITFVEDNHWFSDQFFTKYSFPFNIYLIEDLIKVFGELLDDNIEDSETYFEVTYTNGDKIESAILEIQTQKGSVLSVNTRFGFDELPNWNKKLSELPLEVAVIADIYAHAKTIISQTWPAVNYNYPQIHTDKYDITEDAWLKFKKIINNYNGTDFLVNTFIAEDFANRNIIQPLPAFLHILTVLFSDAGYNLKGSVTTNEIFQKLLLFADLDYFNKIQEGVFNVVVKNNEQDSIDSNQLYHYSKSIVLTKASRYKVVGLAMFNNEYINASNFSFVKISYRGTNIFYKFQSDGKRGYSYFDINTIFETIDDDNAHTLDFTAVSGRPIASRQIFGNEITPGDFDGVKVEKVIVGIDNPPAEIHLHNEIDLKKVVPDITGGTFVTVCKNWFNIDLDIVGKDIYMNFIEDEINYSNAEDLSEYEEIEPEKKRNNNNSFLLKFDDTDNYIFDEVFQNKEVVELGNNKVTSDTNTITINAFPLPQKNILGIETAYAFDQGGNSKIYAVLYNGLNTAGLNLTEASTPLRIPAIHSRFYEKWFTFRIKAVTYQWSFKMFIENLNKIKKKVYAYGRYHIIKTISKTQISEDLYEVDIETDTIN